LRLLAEPLMLARYVTNVLFHLQFKWPECVSHLWIAAARSGTLALVTRHHMVWWSFFSWARIFSCAPSYWQCR
jgi:hypothetical protein